MFSIKDQGGDDTLRFLETLNENTMKNMREMVSHTKSFEKLIFLALELNN